MHFQHIRDFYRLAARNKKVTADNSSFSNIEFVGTAEEKSTSTQIRFVPPSGRQASGQFEQSMVGGTISIPNFFLVDRIFPPVIPTADEVGLGTTLLNGVLEMRGDVIGSDQKIIFICSGYRKYLIEGKLFVGLKLYYLKVQNESAPWAGLSIGWAI